MKKRKFFSFMLMGLLTLGATSMVTSCKDYDDDINNLQDEQASLTSQISSLQSTLSSVQSAAASHATTEQLNAVQSQVTSQGTQLNSLASQVTTAISNAASAQEAATAAQNAVDALKAQIPDVSGFATKAELANYVTATALNEQLETFKTEIQNANKEQLDEIKANVAKYDTAINTLYTAVTQVDIVGMINTAINDGDYVTTGKFQRVRTATGYSGQWIELRFTDGAINANAVNFGAKIAANAGTDKYGDYEGNPKHDYTKDSFVKKSESIIVRISPANATINTSMLKLINSQGNEIEGVQIDSVSRYNELLTRAGESGLWRIYVSPTKYLAESAQPEGATTTVDGAAKAVSYYVAVNNTSSVATADNNAADRYVTSPEDVVFGPTQKFKSTAQADLTKITVKAASEKDAHNIGSLRGRGNGAYVSASTAATAANTVYAQNGENITVSFENVPTVDRFYVVRDNNNASAGNSQTSDINAWNSYTYTGCVGGVTSQEVAQVIEVNGGTGKGTFSVQIPGETGDEVAFRIYAVDPDGQVLRQAGYDNAYGIPFIVYVGSEKTTATVTGTVTADDAADARTITLPLTGALKNGTTMIPVNTALDFEDSKGGTVTFYPRWYDKDDNEVTAANKLSTVTYVKLFRNSGTPWSNWDDDSHLTYTITTTGTGEDKTVENIINFDLTKVLPDYAYTVAKYGYTWRSGQPKNPYVAFVIPSGSDWANTTKQTSGTTDLDQPLDGLTNGTTISVQNTLYNNDSKAYTDPFDAEYTATNTHWTVNVAEALFHNGTSEAKAASIKHVYKDVTTSTKNKNWTVDVEDFTITYACPLDPTYTTVNDAFKTYTANKVTYRVDQLYYGDDTKNNATTKYESSKGLLDYGVVEFTSAAAKTALGFASSSTVTLKQLLTKYAAANISYEVLSDENNNADYFTADADASLGVKFTSIVGKQAPEADVPSHLVITATDVYGHKNVYKVALTVMKGI